jgi:phospholipid/cholesterol/gamma-HCH transport system substrate-binding protein
MRALFKQNVTESLIGLLVLIVAVWFVQFTYARTERGGGRGGYQLSARFPNSTGVTVGTDVRISGIKVGTVTAQKLDPASFQAVMQLSVADSIKLPTDSSAAITSEGLLGGNYISLIPGGDTTTLKPGAEIVDTQGAQDLMGLVGSFINKTGSAAAGAGAAPGAAAAPAGAAKLATGTPTPGISTPGTTTAAKP